MMFLVVIGLGIDVVSIDRIEQAMLRPRFLSRILTESEREAKLTPEYVAGRWAAKEALYKARGGFHWQDVSIIRTSKGPTILWHNNAPANNIEILLSLSHEQHFACAVAIVQRTPET